MADKQPLTTTAADIRETVRAGLTLTRLASETSISKSELLHMLKIDRFTDSDLIKIERCIRTWKLENAE